MRWLTDVSTIKVMFRKEMPVFFPTGFGVFWKKGQNALNKQLILLISSAFGLKYSARAVILGTPYFKLNICVSIDWKRLWSYSQGGFWFDSMSSWVPAHRRATRNASIAMTLVVLSVVPAIIQNGFLKHLLKLTVVRRHFWPTWASNYNTESHSTSQCVRMLEFNTQC